LALKAQKTGARNFDKALRILNQTLGFTTYRPEKWQSCEKLLDNCDTICLVVEFVARPSLATVFGKFIRHYFIVEICDDGRSVDSPNCGSLPKK